MISPAPTRLKEYIRVEEILTPDSRPGFEPRFAARNSIPRFKRAPVHSLDGDDAVRLSLALLLDLNVRSRLVADGVDVGPASPNYPGDSRGRYRHTLRSRRRRSAAERESGQLGSVTEREQES